MCSVEKEEIAFREEIHVNVMDWLIIYLSAPLFSVFHRSGYNSVKKEHKKSKNIVYFLYLV